MDAAIRALDEALRRPEFVAELQGFTAQHCEAFDDGETNQLGWTQIHEQYVALVPGGLSGRLGLRGRKLWQLK